jgi:putative zinc finger/helix-turn-helix YgiT family protein
MTHKLCHGKKPRKRKATMDQPYHFIESGLDNIYLVGITVYRCDSCEEELPEIPSIAQLHDKIAERLVTKPSILAGPEIRFLRKNLGLLASEFAKFLDTTPVSVSRWETGEQPVAKENDKLIRYFFLRYKEEKTNSRIRQASVEQLSHTDESAKALNMNVRVRPHGDVTTEFVEAVA